jgi:lysyl-tRNA synthetase class 2
MLLSLARRSSRAPAAAAAAAVVSAPPGRMASSLFRASSVRRRAVPGALPPRASGTQLSAASGYTKVPKPTPPPSAETGKATPKPRPNKSTAKQHADAAASSPPSAPSSAPPDLPPPEEEYRALRQQELQSAGICDPRTGVFPYPNTLHPTLTVSEFLTRYSALAAGERAEDEVCLTGRVHSKRDASSKLIFYDLIGSEANPPAPAPPSTPPRSDAAPADDSSHLTDFTAHSPKVQIMATLAAHGVEFIPSADTPPLTPEAQKSSFRTLHHLLRRGDLIFARGRPQKTKTGELSLVPREVKLLAPCWREIPMKLTDPVSVG